MFDAFAPKIVKHEEIEVFSLGGTREAGKRIKYKTQEGDLATIDRY